MARILVVEDDQDIALALRIVLTRSGHEVERASDGGEALRVAYETKPDLLVLDIGLPVLDGWEVLSRLRDLSDVPVLMLTAAGRDEDKVRGLRSGADDYLTKPFSNTELVARVAALLRRAGRNAWPEDDLTAGDLVISPVSRTVTLAGREIAVTPLEFRLLSVMVRHTGQVLTTRQLLSLVWDDPSGVGPDRVKFTMLRLRRKLGWDDSPESPIRAVRGVGYRLD